MIVLKFGGTSVGTVESLFNVKKIVESLEDDAIVVVSALGGLTDRLIATASMAAGCDDKYKEEWQAMADRHHNIINGVISDSTLRDSTFKTIDNLLNELRRLYDGVSLIADLPERTLAQIVSLGERMSSVIVANMIENASHLDSLSVIKTEKWFDKNIASTELTTSLIRENLGGERSYPIVMGGFISTDKDTGEITNLGRGGSDYTAALVAAALDADVLQIWTDVDGFLTADPRIVPEATVIDTMSFVESMDLCTFGAKVIYPPTIYPVFHKNIPIRILNTHRPDAPGTFISEHAVTDNRAVTGISALKNEALVTLRGQLAADSRNISSRCFNTLARKGLSAHLVAQDIDRNSFSFAISGADIHVAVRLLKEEFAPELVDGILEVIEVISDLASLAAVGDNIRKMPAISSKIRNTLSDKGIEIFAYSDKASETALSFVIKECDVPEALRTLHSALF